jgi:hypothetical protein
MDLAYKKGIIERYIRLSVSGRIDFPHHGYKLVSCFKNNIEEFNVEPGAERWAPPKSAGNAGQRIHPFASAEERPPFGQGLVST